MANYGKVFRVASVGAVTCPERQPADEILVCGRRVRSDPRLPLPDERFGPGEVVSHPAESQPATNAFRGPPREPSRLGQTLAKGVGLIKGLVTGEDPNP